MKIKTMASSMNGYRLGNRIIFWPEKAIEGEFNTENYIFTSNENEQYTYIEPENIDGKEYSSGKYIEDNFFAFPLPRSSYGKIAKEKYEEIQKTKFILISYNQKIELTYGFSDDPNIDSIETEMISLMWNLAKEDFPKVKRK